MAGECSDGETAAFWRKAGGQLKGTKQGRLWRVRKEDLPLELTESQRAQLDSLESTAERAVQTHARYSVLDLKAFQAGRPLYQEAAETLGDDSPLTERLHQALQQLALGCHVFHPEEKVNHYAQARVQIALTVADLLVFDKGTELAERLEADLLPKISGLIRTAERQESDGRFRSFGSKRRRRA